MNDVAAIECQNLEQALKLIEIARGLGFQTTYFPLGGIDNQQAEPIRHFMGILGNTERVNNFLQNYGH